MSYRRKREVAKVDIVDEDDGEGEEQQLYMPLKQRRKQRANLRRKRQKHFRRSVVDGEGEESSDEEVGKRSRSTAQREANSADNGTVEV